MEDKAIVFTISYVSEIAVRVYTNDARWGKEKLTMDFNDVSPSALFDCMSAITTIGNTKGFAVIFEVD